MLYVGHTNRPSLLDRAESFAICGAVCTYFADYQFSLWYILCVEQRAAGNGRRYGSLAYQFKPSGSELYPSFISNECTQRIGWSNLGSDCGRSGIDWDGGNPLFENYAENAEQNRNRFHCITAVRTIMYLPPYESDIPAIFANICLYMN